MVAVGEFFSSTSESANFCGLNKKTLAVRRTDDQWAGSSHGYAEDQYKLATPSHVSQLNRALASGIETGIFVQPKGPSGCVKLAPRVSAGASKENSSPVSTAKKPSKPVVKAKAKPSAVAKKSKATTVAKPKAKAATTKPAAAKKPAAPKKVLAGKAKAANVKKTTTASKRVPAKKAVTGDCEETSCQKGSTCQVLHG
ncbi:hypothetical protein B0H19DRAFT_1379645 [Mycena capillaripes]|nr:hypothetical protein B0H19DRAFT_1379645 [Mycena capillaripes]